MTENARILMCRPDHFGVTYSINPWMNPADWAGEAQALATRAKREWRELHRTLKGLGASVHLVPPEAGLPDLVFTANAAVVMDRVALLARFRHPERQGEEAHFERAFAKLAAAGLLDEVRRLPAGLRLEGAGDCVWDRTRGVFWMGHGQRSDAGSRDAVEDCFGVETVALELVDPRFYHMDTALCPLSGGELLYVPSAFSAAGRAEIEARVEPRLRIAVGADDAALFAANAVNIGDDIVMSRCGDALRRRLEERGYRLHQTPLGAFALSGGSAFCLTLRLDNSSQRARSGATERAPALAFG